MALISTLSFSVAAPVARIVINLGVNPTTMLLIRFVLTLTALGILLLPAGPTRLAIDRRAFLITFGAGLMTGVAMLAFFWSLTRLDASIASMLFSFYPLVILSLLALRGERLAGRKLIRLGLGIAGVYLLIGPGGLVDPLGVVLVLLSVVAASVQILFIQWYLHGYNSLTATFYLTLGTLVTISGWWLLQGAPWTISGGSVWLGIAVLVLISTLLARLTMFAAIQRLGSGQVALLVPLENLLTVVWSVIFLKEQLSWLQLLGSGLILLSAILAVIKFDWLRWRPR